jgi:hypothetical protein
VIDLTRAMTSDGRLRWTPPPGRWAVLRLGSSSTGHLNGPAPPEATGLEVDKLDAGKVGAYLDTYLAPYASAAGPHLFGAAGVRALLNDSIEAGPQNWTDAMLADFQRLRGYDPRPWLPTLTGVIVGDAASSDRFLWDWRRTLAELLAENHYGQIARSAHARGLIVYGEALEDHRPQLGDDLEMRRYTDVPMGAMWWIPPDEAPRATFVADDRGAASVGHIYGQPVIAAESLTAFGRPWDFAPRDLKRTVDLEFALGINRIVIHTSTHEPQSAGKPGLALAPFLGQYFTRNETWAEQARPWIDYLARSAFLLQQGRFVADVAYFYGEEAPLTAQFGDHPPADAPRGYGWDFVNADVILHRLSIDKGALTTATGMRYRVLYLGAGARRMTLPVLRKLSDLVDAGAVLVGPAPIDSPSLADDPQAFGALVARLWTPDAARSEGAVHGQGRVFARGDANAALSELGVAPDVVFHGESAGAELMGLHRRAADADLYFITNQKARPEWVRVLLRTSGKAAELWRAEDGSRVAATYRPEGDRTAVDLDLGPQDAVFVVLRGKASPGAHAAPRRTEQTLAALTQGWRLSFEPGRGAPSGEAPARLGAWTESPAAGVRYFSGTARYATTFTLPKGRRGRGARLALDLGDVRDLAEVRVDGRPVGIAWKPPYRLALSPALKPGRHRLEVRVTNPWRNRLIGDAQPGATRIARTTGPTWSADAPLRPAGLLGPVRILVSTPTR